MTNEKEETFDLQRFKKETMEGLYASKKAGDTDGESVKLFQRSCDDDGYGIAKRISLLEQAMIAFA